MNTVAPSVEARREPNYLEEHPFDLETYPLPGDITLEEVLIPMRDGIRLAANVFRRPGAAAAPVIVTSTPYGKDNYDQWNNFRDAPVGNVPGGGFYLGSVRISDHTAFEAPDPGYWVPHGYVVVLVDHPGMGRSESNPTLDPPLEERWHDIISWLVKQPWCSGSVGMSGVSALCATQWIAAKDPAPSALKAIIPWEGINESGPAGGYGGIPEIAFPGWLKSQWIGPNVNHAAHGPERLLFDWKYDTTKISIPALICASFSDQELHTWDTFDAFTRIASKDKWLYGHRRQKWGAFYGTNELEYQRAFLDRFLKGDASAFQNQPVVRLEINESRFDYEVTTADNWPLPATSYDTLYLDAERAALSSVPGASSITKPITATNAGDPQNSLSFDLTFEKPTTLVGHMALSLFIEAQDSDDADIFVGIEKIDANGNKVYFFSASGGNANGPVTRGWLRASKRKLNRARSTEWRPVLDLSSSSPLVPGQVTEVNVPLMPSGTKFQVGETLRLVVQSWSIPGQWEGGETRQWDTLKKGSCRVHTGPEFPSRLLVPVIP